MNGRSTERAKSKVSDRALGGQRISAADHSSRNIKYIRKIPAPPYAAEPTLRNLIRVTRERSLAQEFAITQYTALELDRKSS